MNRETAKNVVILILLAAVIFSLVTGVLRWRATVQAGLKDRSEFFGGYRAFISPLIEFSRAENWEMTPTIRENDTIMWVRAQPESVMTEDIIIYRRGNVLDVKRVLAITDNYFVVKGDASPENFAILKQIEGIVIGVIYTSYF
ncbi:MAG: hypothetical protein QW179_03160 [Candidatus Hadarchaeales archaeon]